MTECNDSHTLPSTWWEALSISFWGWLLALVAVLLLLLLLTLGAMHIWKEKARFKSLVVNVLNHL